MAHNIHLRVPLRAVSAEPICKVYEGHTRGVQVLVLEDRDLSLGDFVVHTLQTVCIEVENPLIGRDGGYIFVLKVEVWVKVARDLRLED